MSSKTEQAAAWLRDFMSDLIESAADDCVMGLSPDDGKRHTTTIGRLALTITVNNYGLADPIREPQHRG